MSKTTQIFWAVAVTWKTDSRTSERSRITSGSSVSHWSLLSVNLTQTTQRSRGSYWKETYPRIINIWIFPRIMADNQLIRITAAVLDSLIRRIKASPKTEACRVMNQRMWILIMISAAHLGIISRPSEMHIESVPTINRVTPTITIAWIKITTIIIGIIPVTILLATLAVINTKITRKT